jgi:predicted O-methyltransferase YrrM
MGLRAAKAPAWRLVRHALGVGDVTCLRRLLSPQLAVDRPMIESLLEELRGSRELIDALESNGRLFSGLPAGRSGQGRLQAQARLEGTGRGRAILLYAVVRLARPSIVVETGCFTGWDSAVLLQALGNNGHGHLYTIDLPAEEGRFSQVGRHSGLPPDLPIGFLVPPAFKDRWTLIVGDVRAELEPLLSRIPQVDLFYHDSDHSYGHMMWELTTVWPRMGPGAVAVADDISWNTAFWDFARRRGRRPVIHRRTPNVGALAK